MWVKFYWKNCEDPNELASIPTHSPIHSSEESRRFYHSWLGLPQDWAWVGLKESFINLFPLTIYFSLSLFLSAVQPKYPIAHKRSQSKMLNEGMEALRQIATTSLFMQNEQKTAINRVVPIINEPESMDHMGGTSGYRNIYVIFDQSILLLQLMRRWRWRSCRRHWIFARWATRSARRMTSRCS